MARRLPVYFLLDVSGSMTGEPIAAVQNGLQTTISALLSNPLALEAVYISIITFSNSAEQIVPLTALTDFSPPQLTAGGMTSLGEALKLVTECAEREVVRTTAEARGDRKPLVIILTAGASTDDFEKGLAEFRKRKWGTVIACNIDCGADTNELFQITDQVWAYYSENAANVTAFFDYIYRACSSEWNMCIDFELNASPETCSQSADADAEGYLDLPPPPPELIEIT